MTVLFLVPGLVASNKMRLKDGVGPLITINNGNNINNHHLNHQINSNTTNNTTTNFTNQLRHQQNLNEQIQTILKNTNDTLDAVVNNTQWSYTDICTNNTQLIQQQQQQQLEANNRKILTTVANNRNHQQQQQQQQNYNRKDLLQNYNNNLASSNEEETTTTILNHLQQQQQQQRNNITTTCPTVVLGGDSNHSGTIRPPRRNITSSSLCSAESSPDDSLLEYEEPQQSCSSVDTSPQGDEEDRGFELSDSESLSDDGNLSGGLDETHHHHCHRRGIVNPNYPGFQHLAHTLEYSIKTTHTSDTDFTDDDLDLDQSLSPQPPTSLILNNINNNTNNNNNNNNNNEEVVGGGGDSGVSIVDEGEEFKIDSVNRLDSVENISKVFYDKPKFNLPLEESDVTEAATTEVLNIINVEEHENNSACALIIDTQTGLNIKNDDLSLKETNTTVIDECACADPIETSIVKEEFQSDKQVNVDDIQAQLKETDEVTIKSNENTCAPASVIVKDDISISQSISIDDIIGDFGKELEQELDRRIELNQIEKAIVKLAISPDKDKEPAAFKYNIEPNVNEPFKTVSKDELIKPTEIKRVDKMDTMIHQHQTAPPIMEHKINILTPLMFHHHYPETIKSKMADAFLSDTRDDIVPFEKPSLDSNRQTESQKIKKTIYVEQPKISPVEKFCKEDLTKNEKEKDELEENVVPRKKEKMEINHHASALNTTVVRRELSGRNRSDSIVNRRSAPASTTQRSSNSSGATGADKKRTSPDIFGGFDVYNIETAMPNIDLDAIETHLRAAREEERRRRTDREEIRRRLAMGSESDDYYTPGDRPGRKPSLQARLQSGMNLQICFMNETVSDSDSPNSDNESTTITTPAAPNNNNSKLISRAPPYHKSTPTVGNNTRNSRQLNGQRPLSLPISQPAAQPPLTTQSTQSLTDSVNEADFFARQARLQIEARMALAQAKEMAHMQMEVERQRQKKSPITEMVRSSLEKVGIQFPEERRRVSRQILTEMNVAQLQVIVNDLHTQIEGLNEGLVRFLMDRDDLHMEQDSMLVDIEDLTRYLGAKEQSVKEQKLITPPVVNNNIPPPSPLMAISSSMKPRLHRIASLVKK
ncbi:putative uncharacterized protein DDB_G0282133 [Chrysoperla carnea]|uniref:putative uncharacterized protein DDB_G0282133 n=1 Tax=Chrysoperla carnea TaxID=189513 RepID=UPI001D07AEBC|nr:putative uncharacterized protein DDB_G0282133 [Chrysoperla carnea]